MNKVQLLGRLARDPEIKYTQGDKPIAITKFTLCVNRPKNKEGKSETDFINCKALGSKAEVIEKFVKKGERLLIQGSWQTGSYENKDGSKVYTNECLVTEITFIENSKDEEPKSTEPSCSIDDFEDSDLPF